MLLDTQSPGAKSNRQGRDQIFGYVSEIKVTNYAGTSGKYLEEKIKLRKFYSPNFFSIHKTVQGQSPC